MEASLHVSSTLEHDGDGCVRYSVGISNRDFSASTWAWGGTEDHLALADALTGFPQASSSRATYKFGTPGTGTCVLEFSCTDNLGHVGVWGSVESTYPVGRTDNYESARVFLRCDPSAIDQFVSALRRFAAGSANVAVLTGLGP